MKMFLISGFLPFLTAAAATPPQQPPSQDPVPVVRRVAATAQLAAQEYRLGVVDGRIIAQAEVDEARLFLGEARRSAALLPSDAGRPALAGLDSLLGLVARTASPDTIEARVRTLSADLSERLNVALDELPAEAPSLTRGAGIYQANCAGCHGLVGRGDGAMAAGLDSPPANLTDWGALRDQSPLDYFRRITIGVIGTSMPAFESRLPAEDRWSVALYSSLLRLPAAAGDVPRELQAFATTGKMSDVQLLETLGAAEGDPEGLARVARIRGFQADPSPSASSEVFDKVRAQVESTYALARTGDPAAPTHALDAYMTFERVESSVRAKDPSLAAELEAAFADLRTYAGAGAASDELDAARYQLAAVLERAERALGDTVSPLNLFVQSFVILLREGLEAILIVGALLAFLVKMGAQDRRRDVNFGVGAAVIASLLTALALETVFQLSPARREVLEGITMVVATVVLFYVSYWLFSRMEVVKWNQFVKGKVQDALTSGSALALVSAAFLAVYREGFETVLFYKALFLAGGPSGGTIPIVAGILVGSMILVGAYFAIHRFGVRLPLKPFFGVTSAFLYYMAFVFAGKGVAELQEGGLVPSTFLPWVPRLPALGIYPTVESLALQAVLLVLLVAALLWTFGLQPRRLRTGPERMERHASLPEPTPTSSEAPR
ncbi:MAG: FTR1 family protein [Gemmatimonadales bacterium]